MKDPRKGLRDAEFSPGGGEDAKESSMLTGLAKDGLTGKNVTVQYETSSNPPKGKLGGEPSGE